MFFVMTTIIIGKKCSAKFVRILKNIWMSMVCVFVCLSVWFIIQIQMSTWIKLNLYRLSFIYSFDVSMRLAIKIWFITRNISYLSILRFFWCRLVFNIRMRSNMILLFVEKYWRNENTSKQRKHFNGFFFFFLNIKEICYVTSHEILNCSYINRVWSEAIHSIYANDLLDLSTPNVNVK